MYLIKLILKQNYLNNLKYIYLFIFYNEYRNIILIKNNRNSYDLKITDFGIGRQINVPLGNYSNEVIINIFNLIASL